MDFILGKDESGYSLKNRVEDIIISEGNEYLKVVDNYRKALTAVLKNEIKGFGASKDPSFGVYLDTEILPIQNEITKITRLSFQVFVNGMLLPVDTKFNPVLDMQTNMNGFLRELSAMRFSSVLGSDLSESIFDANQNAAEIDELKLIFDKELPEKITFRENQMLLSPRVSIIDTNALILVLSELEKIEKNNKRKVTGAQIKELTGITRPMISELLSGKISFTPDSIQKFLQLDQRILALYTQFNKLVNKKPILENEEFTLEKLTRAPSQVLLDSQGKIEFRNKLLRFKKECEHSDKSKLVKILQYIEDNSLLQQDILSIVGFSGPVISKLLSGRGLWTKEKIGAFSRVLGLKNPRY